ncbi:MAG: CARDB domain-containing protein, partial [Candidatus Heimdallarchaeota archaeon]
LFSYFDNTSTYFPTWYRFPKINVKEVIVSPSKPTEFRRLQLDILVQNNGTIPSAPFWVTVYVNDSLQIHTTIDGLDINQSIPVIFEEFQGLGIKILNVSIFTDSRNQIFELLEFDNALEFFIQINRNWNIIYTSIAIAVLILGFVGYRIAKRLIRQRRRNRTRFDVILSDIEV